MYEQINSNKRKSWALFVLFFIFLLGLGWIFGYALFGVPELGLIITAIIAVIAILVAYYKSDAIVLNLTKAREVKKAEYPHLFHTIEGLSLAAGIPKPKLYVMEDKALNAFATGRSPENGVVVVTTGLVEKLDRLEIEGVLAHEMSHIKNFDIRFGTMVVVLVGLVALISDIMLRSFIWGGAGRSRSGKGGGGAIIIIALVLAILTPFIAAALRLAISRKREFLADADGALLTRYPEGLASALEKLEGDKRPLATANKATAHLFISNPLKKSPKFLDGLFSTHPKTEDRVKALRGMGSI